MCEGKSTHVIETQRKQATNLASSIMRSALWSTTVCLPCSENCTLSGRKVRREDAHMKRIEGTASARKQVIGSTLPFSARRTGHKTTINLTLESFALPVPRQIADAECVFLLCVTIRQWLCLFAVFQQTTQRLLHLSSGARSS
jgi:hypothetical protein